MDTTLIIGLFALGATLGLKALKEEATYDEVIYRLGGQGRKPAFSEPKEKVKEAFTQVGVEFKNWPSRRKEIV